MLKEKIQKSVFQIFLSIKIKKLFKDTKEKQLINKKEF